MVGEGDAALGEIFSLRDPDARFCPLVRIDSVGEERGELGEAGDVLVDHALVGLLVSHDHGIESIGHVCRSLVPSSLDILDSPLELILQVRVGCRRRRNVGPLSGRRASPGESRVHIARFEKQFRL